MMFRLVVATLLPGASAVMGFYNEDSTASERYWMRQAIRRAHALTLQDMAEGKIFKASTKTSTASATGSGHVCEDHDSMAVAFGKELGIDIDDCSHAYLVTGQDCSRASPALGGQLLSNVCCASCTDAESSAFQPAHALLEPRGETRLPALRQDEDEWDWQQEHAHEERARQRLQSSFIEDLSGELDARSLVEQAGKEAEGRSLDSTVAGKGRRRRTPIPFDGLMAQYTATGNEIKASMADSLIKMCEGLEVCDVISQAKFDDIHAQTAQIAEFLQSDAANDFKTTEEMLAHMCDTKNAIKTPSGEAFGGAGGDGEERKGVCAVIDEDGAILGPLQDALAASKIADIGESLVQAGGESRFALLRHLMNTGVDPRADPHLQPLEINLEAIAKAGNLKPRYAQALTQVKSKLSESMLAALQDYGMEWDEEKADLQEQRGEADELMSVASRDAKESMETSNDEHKRDADDTRRDASNEVKSGEEDLKELDEDEMESIEEEMQVFDDKSDKVRADTKKFGQTVIIGDKNLGSDLSKFEKTAEKDATSSEKKVAKYETTTEKVGGKTESGFSRTLEKTLKEGEKADAVVTKELAKDIVEEEKDAVKKQGILEKKIGKEEKGYDKELSSAEKQLAKDLKEILRGQSNVEGFGDDLSSDVESIKEDLEEAIEKFKTATADAKANQGDAVSSTGSNLLSVAQETAQALQSSVESAYSDSAEKVSSSLESLQKALTDGQKGTMMLDAQAKRSRVSMQGEVDVAKEGVSQSSNLANQGYKLSEGFSNKVSETESFMSSALAEVENLDKIQTAQMKKEAVMMKAKMLAKSQGFAERNANVGKLDADVQSFKAQTADEIMQVAKSFSQVIADDQAANGKQVGDMKRAAASVASSSAAEAAAVNSLGQQDAATIQRFLNTAQKEALTKVSSLNATLQSRLVQATMAFLKKASASAKNTLEKRSDSADEEAKEAAAKRALGEHEDLQRLADLIRGVDAKDVMNSEGVSEADARLLERLEEARAVIALTTGTIAKSKESYLAGQDAVGQGAVAALGMRTDAGLNQAIAHEGSFLDELVSHSHSDETRTLNQEEGRFTTYMQSLKEKTEDYVKRGLAASRESEQLAAEDASKAGTTVADDERKVAAVLQLLESLGRDLGTDTVTVERDTQSSLTESRRSQQALLAEAAQGITSEVDSAQTGLSRVSQVLQDLYSGYGHDSDVQDSKLTNYEEQTKQTALAKIAAIMGGFGQRGQQIAASDKATAVALSDGLRRWSDAESNADSKEGIFERNIMTRNAEAVKADGLKASTALSEDRAGAGLDTLGSEADNLGVQAGNLVNMAGSESETQAKAAGISTEMRLQGIESTEQRAYEMQDARDHALSSAVGDELSRVRDVQLQSARDQQTTQFSVDSLRKVLYTELDAIQKNVQYLKHYNQVTMETLTHMLGETTLGMVKRAHMAQEGYAALQADEGSNDMKLDELEGSEAYQTLAKIEKADDYSLEVMMEDDMLEDWMKTYQQTADAWRENVEKTFGEHDEAAALHAEEVRKTDEEHKRHSAELERMGTSSIEGMLGTMQSASAKEIEEGFQEGMTAFENKQNASGQLDEDRIKNLIAMQTSLEGKMGTALKDGQDALQETRGTAGGGTSQLFTMQEILRKMASMHDQEVAQKMKNLQSRQATFDQNLLFASVGSQRGPPAAAPSQGELDALVEEAKELSQKHNELDAKRVHTGQDIEQLFGKLLGALQTQQSAPAAA